jgi:hypothetical protein
MAIMMHGRRRPGRQADRCQGHWSGGKTTLVQMGDVVDRGPDSLKIIHDLSG